MRLNKRNDKGFAASWMLGFSFLVLFLGIFFFELGNVYVERQKLVSAADAAAAAGASAIDEDHLLTDGNIRLDPVLARERCVNSMLKAADEETGSSGTILDLSASECEVSTDQSEVVAQARGSIKFGPVFRALQVPNREFTVTANGRPSCSDNSSFEGSC